jgi:hypothetical protein
VLGFDLKTGTRVTIAKDFPPEIDKLEARLTQCGAQYTSEILVDPGRTAASSRSASSSRPTSAASSA